METTCTYSVITPVYRNRESLPLLLERIGGVMEQLGTKYEIICVDDASPDGAWSCLTAIHTAGKWPLRLVRLAYNHGQHKALLCGMSVSRATEAVVLLDADLQTPPEEIAALISAYELQGHAVVYGLADEHAQRGWRRWGSRWLGRLLQRTGALAPVASSFKLISRPLTDQLVAARFEYVFLDAMIAWFTRDIGAVEVAHDKRPHGHSSYNFWRLSSMALHILINYTALPLRFMTYSGLFVATICFGLGVYFFINKLIYDVPLGFTATIVIITFGLSLILFCLGIIGDYVRRLYFSHLNKPAFSIKEIIE